MPSTGSQLTDFTETTKRQIETAYGAHCWHCESSPIRNAYVIAQASDRARVCGITSLNSINPWTKWKQVSRLQNLDRISLQSYASLKTLFHSVVYVTGTSIYASLGYCSF